MNPRGRRRRRRWVDDLVATDDGALGVGACAAPGAGACAALGAGTGADLGAGSADESPCHLPDGHYDPTHFNAPDAVPAAPQQQAPELLAPAGPAPQFRDHLFDPSLKDVSVDQSAAEHVPEWLKRVAEEKNDGRPPEDNRSKKLCKHDDFNAGSLWMAGMLEVLRKDQVPIGLRQQLLDGCLKHGTSMNLQFDSVKKLQADALEVSDLQFKKWQHHEAGQSGEAITGWLAEDIPGVITSMMESIGASDLNLSFRNDFIDGEDKAWSDPFGGDDVRKIVEQIQVKERCVDGRPPVAAVLTLFMDATTLMMSSSGVSVRPLMALLQNVRPGSRTKATGAIRVLGLAPMPAPGAGKSKASSGKDASDFKNFKHLVLQDYLHSAAMQFVESDGVTPVGRPAVLSDGQLVQVYPIVAWLSLDAPEMACVLCEYQTQTCPICYCPQPRWMDPACCGRMPLKNNKKYMLAALDETTSRLPPEGDHGAELPAKSELEWDAGLYLFGSRPDYDAMPDTELLLHAQTRLDTPANHLLKAVKPPLNHPVGAGSWSWQTLKRALVQWRMNKKGLVAQLKADGPTVHAKGKPALFSLPHVSNMSAQVDALHVIWLGVS